MSAIHGDHSKAGPPQPGLGRKADFGVETTSGEESSVQESELIPAIGPQRETGDTTGDIDNRLTMTNSMPELATVKQHPTLNETVSLQNISERLKSLSTKPGCQNLSESTGLRRHITDLRLECVTGGSGFPALEIVPLVICGLAKTKVGIFPLKRESPETWKQTFLAELPGDLDDLIFVPTSREFIVLTQVAFMVTKNELALEIDTNTHGARFEKNFTSEAPAPVLKLKLSFTVAKTPDATRKAGIVNEFSQTGSNPRVALAPRTAYGIESSQAILAYQRAFELAPNGHAYQPVILDRLELLFRLRFKRSGNLNDISESISAQQRAIELTPEGHTDMPGRLNQLGNLFQIRFGHTGNLKDLSEAISFFQRAVTLTPDGYVGMTGRLNDLGVALDCRFEYMGNLNDISKAISVERQAVQLTPNGHAEMPPRLSNLGNFLRHRFQHTDHLDDISEAISSQQLAIQLTPDGHANMPRLLNNLGSSLHYRFGRSGNLSDISTAILVLQQAVQLTPNGHPDRAGWLNNLAASLSRRFDRTGDLNDITEAISVQQQAVQLTPDGRANKPNMLQTLAASFDSRFKRTRNLTDISEAISLIQRAVIATPDGHSFMPGRLNNLGNSLKIRFRHTGDLSDISEAISVLQQAVQLTPSDHSERRILLNNLAAAYQHRFRRTGDLNDISEAISMLQQAIHLSPKSHADIPAFMTNLGISFQLRFGRTRHLPDISEAISAAQRAVELTPDENTLKPDLLSNLGTSFQYRFQHTGALADIEEAISNQQRAARLTPDGHGDIPDILNCIGNAIMCRVQHTRNHADIHTAIAVYQKSATTFGPPSARMQAALKLVELTMTHDPSKTLRSCGVAVDLMSQFAGMDRTVEQRHTSLIQIPVLTTTAASAALAQGDPGKALEWLEQGRCIVWSQLNQLRTPVDHLRVHHEPLAQRFLEISTALERSGSRQRLGVDASPPQKMSLQDEAHIHVKLAQEWSQLLDEIRCIPTFHDFLRTPPASDLLKHLPSDGPIIFINVHVNTCDALALVSGFDTPIHIPLKEFTYQRASDLRESLRRFLLLRGVRMREEDRGTRPVLDDGTETQSMIHFVLEELWLRVVKPIFDRLAYSSRDPSDIARIWWCPTGPLAFLPLHAAGIYSRNGQSSAGSCISDFAVSSYTPTLGALLEKIKKSDNVRPPLSTKLLIISQPNTPGCSPIPGTTKEMNVVSKAVGSGHYDLLRLEGEAATVSRVKLEMESYASIHFACHASQNIENPLKSGFYLHDGRLELAEIMKQRIAHSELAFLSACQTSTGDEKLSEEAVHLAAGMLAVGYRGVVATMWSIKDQYGPAVAESFYKYLTDKETLDTASAARALHHAVQGIREQVGDTEIGLMTWVPYVHFGY